MSLNYLSILWKLDIHMLLCFMILINRPEEYKIKLILFFLDNIWHLIIISFFLFYFTFEELTHVYFLIILEPIIKHTTFSTSYCQVFVCEIGFILEELFFMNFIYYIDYLLLESFNGLNRFFVILKFLYMINILLAPYIIQFFTIDMLQYSLIVAAHTKLFEICCSYTWVLGHLWPLLDLYSFWLMNLVCIVLSWRHRIAQPVFIRIVGNLTSDYLRLLHWLCTFISSSWWLFLV